ncbi:hypothetical protein CGK76_01460 [Erysipelotrichaceae bacterium 7770_A6]|nr:hypothetical protein [Erysipelotrichaceae bacterium 7770_A6]
MEKETNLEHYLRRLKRIVKEKYNSPRMIFDTIQDYVDPQIKHNCMEYTTDILEWMAQEYKGDILDYAEKKYLSEVIRPFREEVNGIKKQTDSLRYRDFIRIQVGDDYLTFPQFAKGTKYKGLKLEKRYTPEELGL